MAVTSAPAAFTVPAFNIAEHQDAAGWWSTLTIPGGVAASDPGNNQSHYLNTGTYSTMRSAAHGGLTDYAPPLTEIHVEVSAAMALLNQTAEVEHCNDIQHAYAITLLAARNALNAVGHGTTWGPAASQAAAHGLAVAAINANLLVAVGAPAFSIEDNLGQLYTNIANMTQNRDNAGWHTFRPNLAATSNSWSAFFYKLAHGIAGGQAIEVRDLQQGPHFNVPGPASPAVVHH